jgi:sporulation integral membrane protein YlbJ
MSIFSGYPSGAKITSELIASHKITSREGQKILTFSSTSGPLFIIGAVGAGMLKSTEVGYIIFICHILGAIINGILLKLFNKSKYSANETTNKSFILNKNSPTGNIMSKAIVNSLYTSGFIGGYIILFSVIITLLDKITFFSSITKIISIFLPNNISWVPGILFKTSLEISNGCKIISSLPTEYELKLILISFIIAFSGFSIIGQVASIINKTKINLGAYILGKLSHGVISSFLCYILLKVNLFKITTSHSIPFNLFSCNVFLLQLLLCIILLLNILSHIKKNFHYK